MGGPEGAGVYLSMAAQPGNAVLWGRDPHGRLHVMPTFRAHEPTEEPKNLTAHTPMGRDPTATMTANPSKTLFSPDGFQPERRRRTLPELPLPHQVSFTHERCFAYLCLVRASQS